MSRVYLRRPGLDVRINTAVDRSLDSLAGRIFWALLSVGVLYACVYYLAALIGGI